MSTRQYIIVFLCFTVALRASADIQNVGWWENSVFYQIYPRSFMDGDKDDGIGDLKGITSKLEHFVDIGVKGIWLSPINKGPMKDLGYDISDFRDIQEEYGSIEDFDELVKRAKELGLKVILDLVPNHTSDEHEWFEKSVNRDGKYTDFYIWVDPNGTDTKTPPNNWLSVFGNSAWTFNEIRKQWYFHQFLPEQPDLNYRNPEVKREMEQIIYYWLSKGVDGFRIDAVPHLFEERNIKLDEPPSNATNVKDTDYAYLDHIYTKDQPETYELVHSWRLLVDNYANANNEDEKVLMTEAYTTLPNTLKFYDSGSHVPFNFKFIIDANQNSKPADFKKIMDSWINGTPESGVPNWVMGNHDRKRVATRYPGRGDQMTMLAMILPGVAITYYGEEIGMVDNDDITFEETKDTQACKAGKTNYKETSRDPCRTPFQWIGNETNAGFSNSTKTWLPINENYETLNLEDQKKDSNITHYHVYKSLTNLRSSSSALKSGSYESIVQNNVLIVKRSDDTQLVTLLINFSDQEAQKIPLSNITDKELLKTEIKVASTGSEVKVNTELKEHIVTIPAKASIVTVTSYKPENNGVSKEHSDSMLIMILLSITVMALRS